MDELQAQINSLQQEIEDLKTGTNSGFQLTFPLDTQSDNIIRETISKEFIDLFWNNVFLYSTDFQSLDGFDTSTVSASVSLGSLGGVYLSTTATSPSSASVYRLIDSSAISLFSTEVRFRARVLFDTAADQTFEVYVGDTSSEDSFGFVVNDDAVSGFIETGGSTRTTVDLNFDVSASVGYRFEAHFFQNERVDFFIDGTPYGSISTSVMPSTNSTTLWGASLTNTASSARGVYVYFIDLLKRREGFGQ